MTKIEKILEEFPEEEFLVADGFDEAIVGVDVLNFKIIYSVPKIITILMQDNMTEEEAMEYCDYNIISAYVGEKTPIFAWTLDN